MNMKRLSLRLPSVVGAKRLLIVSQLSVGTLCAVFQACQCFNQKKIFSKDEHHRNLIGLNAPVSRRSMKQILENVVIA